MVILKLLDLPHSYESVAVAILFNSVCSVLVSVLVAYLLARSFLVRGTPGLLALSLGVVLFGAAGLSGLGLSSRGVNAIVTVHNSLAWLSAFFQVVSAILMIRPRRALPAAGLWLAIGYAFALSLIGLILVAVLENWTPTFFIQGRGGTPVRQLILATAIGMFVLAACLLRISGRESAESFTRWYSLALGLYAAGLLGVMLQPSVGSVLGWTGRSAQFLGGIYMLIAAVASVRDTRAWQIPLDRALERERVRLRESEQRYRTLFEMMTEGFAVHEIVTDEQGRPSNYRFLDVNPAFERLTGFSIEELRGMELRQMIHPDDLPENTKWIDRMLSGQVPGFTIENRYLRKGGEAVWVRKSVSLVRSPDGSPQWIIALIEDITQRKEAETELKRVNEQLEQKVEERTAELARRAEQLRALTGELTLSEQRERRRLARVLHDHIQQLLVSAKFRTAILGRSGDDLTRQAAAEIELLLDESIKSSRSLTAELSPPILHEGGLAAGLEWLARWMADKHGVIVDLSMEDNLPTLPDDVKVLLFESVRELLFNAVKHAHVSSVTVTVRQTPGGAVRVKVSDEGPGFDPARLNWAGEGGGGFGLFSIRERFDLIGGSLEIDTAPGRGSRFTLTTPVQPALSEAVRVPLAGRDARAATPAHIASPKLGQPIRVLLADDHVVMRQGLARLLACEPGIQIVGEAADGQAAVDLTGRLMPDVILMDMSMPRLNGIEATRIIHASHPDIRIIGLSMFEEAERAAAMLEAGAVAYLTKSGKASNLVATIRMCMEGRG